MRGRPEKCFLWAAPLPTEEVGRRGDRSAPPATGTPAQNREVPTIRGALLRAGWERSRGRGDRLGKGARERGAVMGQPGPAKCPTSVSRLEVRRRWRLARHGDGSDRGTAGPPGPALVAWQR
jgi:hypothetical protein